MARKKTPSLRGYEANENAISTPESHQVCDHLEACGGDLLLFLNKIDPNKTERQRLLLDIRLKLQSNEEAAKRWNNLVITGQQVKLDLVEGELYDTALKKKDIGAIKFILERRDPKFGQKAIGDAMPSSGKSAIEKEREHAELVANAADDDDE